MYVCIYLYIYIAHSLTTAAKPLGNLDGRLRPVICEGPLYFY